jgi:protein SCO1
VRLAATTVLAVLLSGCVRGPLEMMPSFVLVDQAGTTVKSDSLRGHALVVSFVFTMCPEACPLITSQLVRVQARARTEKLDARIRFLSITLDPVTDTPDVLRRYAGAYRVDLTTWYFLTGDPGEVGRVIRGFGLSPIAGDRAFHGSLVLLVDGAGRIAERRTDLELDPDRLMISLRRLLD